ncbi:MAG: M16 family metallopeptidase [Chthoniobacterales bacterium]
MSDISILQPCQISQLANGLRVVTYEMPWVESVAVGIWVGSGSRHEPKEFSGISHFLEHMLFKGTRSRTSQRILQEIEGIGGDINACTYQERTAYYATAPACYLKQITDVLVDLYQNSVLAKEDVDLERSVIAEEIQMYYDDPAEHISDLLNTVFWKKHSLARPITGTLDSIKTIHSKELKKYLKHHYLPDNTCISAAGCLAHEEFLRFVEKKFTASASQISTWVDPESTASIRHRARVVLEERDIQQTQLQLAFPCPSITHSDRSAMNILNVLLAGNSSSRLFQELREKRGYCYSVSSHPNYLSDTGQLSLSLALDSAKIYPSLRLINREVKRFRDRPVSKNELRRAVCYLTGSRLMAMERTVFQNSRIGHAVLSFGKVPDPQETVECYEKLTPQDIQSVSRRYLDLKKSSLATIGKSLNESVLREALEKE